MLTDQDIKNLIEAQKEVFYSKEEMDTKFDAMNENFSNLQSAVVDIASDRKMDSDELKVLNHRIKNTENWIDEAAPKLGVKFEH